MANYEKTGIFTRVDESGNTYELYPRTKADLVEGLSLFGPVTTAGDGAAYTATVDGITELKVGVKLTIIPHVTSATFTPTLDVNGLGAKYIRMPGTYNTATMSNIPVEEWLVAGKPVTVTWEGEQWETDVHRTTGDSLAGIVPIEKGGTGASTLEEAKETLGITALEASIGSGGTGGSGGFDGIGVLGIENGGTGVSTAAEGIGQDITQAEYDALPEEEKLCGTYYITDANGSSVVDNLLSEATDLPLSANQGRVLNEKIDSMPKHMTGDFPANGSITLQFSGFTTALITVMGTATAARLACFYIGYAHGSARQGISNIMSGDAYSYSISETEQKITITSKLEHASAYTITVFNGALPVVS